MTQGIGPADTWFDIVARVAAARVTGARVVASFAEGCPAAWHDRLDACTASWAAGIELVEQSDDAIAELLTQPDLRLRYAARDRVPAALRQQAAALGRWIADVPVVSTGRIELLWVLREQSISHDYHRYGNLGRRSTEPRRTFVHERYRGAVTVSGHVGDDAKPYQEKQLRKALEAIDEKN